MMNANSHFRTLKYLLIMYTILFTDVTYYLNNKSSFNFAFKHAQVCDRKERESYRNLHISIERSAVVFSLPKTIEFFLRSFERSSRNR